jgi:hypothetical protein
MEAQFIPESGAEFDPHPTPRIQVAILKKGASTFVPPEWYVQIGMVARFFDLYGTACFGN